MCRSVPQMDATFTLTNTSRGPKAGIFTSRISAPGAASGFTTASIVGGMNYLMNSNSDTKRMILAPQRFDRVNECRRLPIGRCLSRQGGRSITPLALLKEVKQYSGYSGDP